MALSDACLNSLLSAALLDLYVHERHSKKVPRSFLLRPASYDAKIPTSTALTPCTTHVRSILKHRWPFVYSVD